MNDGLLVVIINKVVKMFTENTEGADECGPGAWLEHCIDQGSYTPEEQEFITANPKRIYDTARKELDYYF